VPSGTLLEVFVSGTDDGVFVLKSGVLGDTHEVICFDAPFVYPSFIRAKDISEDVIEVERFLSLTSSFIFFLFGKLDAEVVFVFDSFSLFPLALLIEQLIDTEGVGEEEKRGLCSPHLVTDELDAIVQKLFYEAPISRAFSSLA
jgi:hypothetical protein